MVSELVKHPVHNINMSLTRIYSVNQYIIKIYYYKDIQLFQNNFINIALDIG